MLKEDMIKRYEGAPWFKNPRHVTIIGAGSTGSHLAYLLSKQVDSITVYDPDVIEPQNIGVQLYSPSQLGMLKVVALRENLKALNAKDGLIIQIHEDHWDSSAPYDGSDIIFSCVDNIQTRRDLAQSWQAGKTFIDIRVSAERGELFVVRDQASLEAYMTSLEGDFPDQTCTFQMTVQCATMMACMAVQVYNNLCVGLVAPFHIYFTGPLMKFEHEMLPSSYMAAAVPSSD